MLRGFSEKQKRVLTWWCDPAFQDREAILCDGAVHSGKNMQSMLVESGVAAAVFAVFLCMVAGRAEREKERNDKKREERRNAAGKG